MQSDINFLPKVASKLTEGYYILDDFPFKIEKPIVSICILQYDNEDYVEELLESVVKSSKDIFTNKIEVIVINDRSPRTEELNTIIDNFKSKYPKLNLRYYKNETNVGQLESRRRLAELARGEYIRYIDGDDLLTENSTDIIIDMIVNNNYPDIIEINNLTIDVDGKISRYDYPQIINGQIKSNKNLLYKYLTSIESMKFCVWNKAVKSAIYRSAFKRINIDERIYMAEDILTVYYMYKCAKTYFGDSTKFGYIYRTNIGTMSHSKRKIKDSIKLHTDYKVINLLYKDILSLKNEYSTEEYENLVCGFRQKIFSHSLAYESFFIENIDKNELDGISIGEINEWFRKGFTNDGKSIWDDYLEIRNKTPRRGWKVPYLVDYFGKQELPFMSICILQYDNEDYVEELLESVVKSSKDIFTNKIEVIVINDRSPRTEELNTIIDNFKSKYPKLNLRYYKNETNVGQLESRRRLAELARGEYIRYIDGDDLLTENSTDIIIDMIVNNNYPDIIDTNYDQIESRDGQWVKQEYNYTEDGIRHKRIYDGYIFSEKNIIYDCLTGEKMSFIVWSKCYRKSVLIDAYNNIPENIECYMGEDLCTTFMIYCSAKSYYGDSKVNTYVYRRGVGCSTYDPNKSISIQDIKRHTSYNALVQVYKYVVQLMHSGKYSVEEYNALVLGFRIKLFRFCLSLDYSYFNTIISSVSKSDKDLTRESIIKFYTDLYGKEIWNKFNELRNESRYSSFLIPWLIDWYGIEELDSSNELLSLDF